MTQEKHTPGPWRVGPFEGHVESESGRFICSAMGTTASPDPGDTIRNENLANAALIAAAPELLEAARLMVEAATDPTLCPEDYERFVDRLESAIAKATGGDS